jgi:hypothetical protein
VSPLTLKKTVGMEASFIEDLSPEAAIVRSRYQAATIEDTAGWKDLAYAVVVKCGN